MNFQKCEVLPDFLAFVMPVTLVPRRVKGSARAGGGTGRGGACAQSGSGAVSEAGESAGASWLRSGIILGKIKNSIFEKMQLKFATKISTQDFGN